MRYCRHCAASGHGPMCPASLQRNGGRCGGLICLNHGRSIFAGGVYDSQASMGNILKAVLSKKIVRIPETLFGESGDQFSAPEGAGRSRTEQHLGLRPVQNSLESQMSHVAHNTSESQKWQFNTCRRYEGDCNAKALLSHTSDT